MEQIKLYVDTVCGRREVEFRGVKLGTREASSPDNTRGAIQTRYRPEDKRCEYLTHLMQWKDKRGNSVRYSLTATPEPDFLPPPPEVGEPDPGRPLTLDEALMLSSPAKRGWLD